jgi:pimeloyl-ACP methyl ester carboxylesterase
MIVILAGVLGLLLAYIAWLAIVWRVQERIVFQPPRHVPSEAIAATRVAYASSDGVPLFAYVVGVRTDEAPVMLAFHGNAELARWLVPWATAVAQATGACVVLAECRGYDGVPGTPTYTASALDAAAALSFVRDGLHVPLSRTVFFGHSLGTAIAAELAARNPPAALVLQSPFTSARGMAARMFVPGLVSVFWNRISRVHFDTEARVRGLNVPVWVTHGDRDRVIPVRMGRAVFAAAARRGELLIVHGAGHNDVAEVGGDAYWRWLSAAIASVQHRVNARGATGT